ncbi:glycosyltransferase, partial [Methylophilaceae bacterium]|nr:glycosyltransferase [Methylophilaceae bacterium]
KNLFHKIIDSYYFIFYESLNYVGFVLNRIINKKPPYVVTFVVLNEQKKWILGAIAREILKHISIKSQTYNRLRNLPDTKYFFFMHYANMVYAYRVNPHLFYRQVFVWYTHPNDNFDFSEKELIYLLNKTSQIFCTCEQFKKLLIAKGVAEKKISVYIGGADPNLFKPHKRGQGKVGFCTAFYERKSPDTIMKIVELMPYYNFILIGKNWKNYSKFESLINLKNFEYVEYNYDQYPRLYSSIDVFVSTSKLEGGPIPLIESMMSNVVPVASKTGFAPDIIRNNVNGYLFDIDCEAEDICKLIDKAMHFPSDIDISSSVENFCWSKFAKKIDHKIRSM